MRRAWSFKGGTSWSGDDALEGLFGKMEQSLEQSLGSFGSGSVTSAPKNSQKTETDAADARSIAPAFERPCSDPPPHRPPYVPTALSARVRELQRAAHIKRIESAGRRRPPPSIDVEEGSELLHIKEAAVCVELATNIAEDCMESVEAANLTASRLCQEICRLRDLVSLEQGRCEQLEKVVAKQHNHLAQKDRQLANLCKMLQGQELQGQELQDTNEAQAQQASLPTITDPFANTLINTVRDGLTFMTTLDSQRSQHLKQQTARAEHASARSLGSSRSQGLASQLPISSRSQLPTMREAPHVSKAIENALIGGMEQSRVDKGAMNAVQDIGTSVADGISAAFSIFKPFASTGAQLPNSKSGPSLPFMLQRTVNDTPPSKTLPETHAHQNTAEKEYVPIRELGADVTSAATPSPRSLESTDELGPLTDCAVKGSSRCPLPLWNKGGTPRRASSWASDEDVSSNSESRQRQSSSEKMQGAEIDVHSTRSTSSYTSSSDNDRSIASGGTCQNHAGLRINFENLPRDCPTDAGAIAPRGKPSRGRPSDVHQLDIDKLKEQTQEKDTEQRTSLAQLSQPSSEQLLPDFNLHGHVRTIAVLLCYQLVELQEFCGDVDAYLQPVISTAVQSRCREMDDLVVPPPEKVDDMLQEVVELRVKLECVKQHTFTRLHALEIADHSNWQVEQNAAASRRDKKPNAADPDSLTNLTEEMKHLEDLLQLEKHSRESCEIEILKLQKDLENLVILKNCLSGNLKISTETNNSLEKELARARVDVEDKLSYINTIQRPQVFELCNDVERLQQELIEAISHARALEQQNAHTQSMLDTLMKRVKEIGDANQILRDQIETLEGDRAEYQSKLAEAHKHLQTVQSKSADAQAKADVALERMEEEMAGLQGRLAEAQQHQHEEQQERERQQQTRAAELESELARLQEEVSTVQKEAACCLQEAVCLQGRLEAQIATLQTQLEDSIQGNKHEKQKFQEQINKLEADRAEYQSKLAAAQEHVQTVQDTAADAQAKADAALERMEEEMAGLQGRLAEAQQHQHDEQQEREQHSAGMEQAYAEVKQRCSDLEECVKEKQAELDAISSCLHQEKAQVMALLNEKERLCDDIERLQQKLIGAYDEVKQRCSNLEECVKDKQAALDAISEELAELARVRVDAEVKLSNIKTNQRAQVFELCNEVERLQQELMEAMSHAKALDSAGKDVEQAYAEVKQRCSDLEECVQQRCAQDAHRLEEEQRQVHTLRNQLAHHEQQLDKQRSLLMPQREGVQTGFQQELKDAIEVQTKLFTKTQELEAQISQMKNDHFYAVRMRESSYVCGIKEMEGKLQEQQLLLSKVTGEKEQLLSKIDELSEKCKEGVNASKFLEDEKEQLILKVEALTVDCKKIDVLTKELEKEGDANKTLTEEMQKQVAAKEMLGTEKDQLVVMIKSLTEELQKEVPAKKMLETEKEQLVVQLKSLTEEMQKEVAANKLLEAEKEQLVVRLKAMEKNIADQMTISDLKEKAIADLKEEINNNKKQEELDAISSCLHQEKAQVGEVAAVAQRVELEERLQDAEMRLSQAENTFSATNGQLQKELVRLQMLLDTRDAENAVRPSSGAPPERDPPSFPDVALPENTKTIDLLNASACPQPHLSVNESPPPRP